MRLNVTINKQREREDGKCQVLMYVSLRGRARYPFPFAIELKRWDDRLKRVRPGPLAVEYNRTIAATLSRAEVLGLEPGMTAKSLVRKLAVPESVGFYEAARARLKKLEPELSYGTILQRSSTLNVIERIRPDLRIADFNTELLEDLELALLGQKLSRNSVSDKLGNLRTIWVELTKGRGLVNPWKEIRLKTVPTMKKGLFPDQMERVMDVDLSGLGFWENLARDLFVCQYLLNGMRWKDACLMNDSWFSNDILTYQMYKTDFIIQWPVHPRAATIMGKYEGCQFEGRRYVFPLMRPQDLVSDKAITLRAGHLNSKINQALVVVSKLAGVPRVTTHWARHSNAVKAKLSGVPNREIQDMMGHSSSQTTDQYVKTLSGTMRLDAYKKMHG